EVSANRTSFTARRGGRATVTPANGQAAAIAPSEEVVIDGTDAPQIAAYAAPELDDWDRWNYARTDHLVDAVSARYVSPGIYGAGPGVVVRAGQPLVGWVALGWGEPVIRWWGAPRHVGVPWWGGWGGPRVVNNVVINRGAAVDAHQITLYRNAGVRNAVVAV